MGRFDYALADGRICIWELNTNPTLLLPPDRYPPDVRARRAELAERLTEAIERLAGEAARERPPVRLALAPQLAAAPPKRTPVRKARVASRPVRALAKLEPRPFVWLARRGG